MGVGEIDPEGPGSGGMNPDSHPKQVDNAGSAITV